LNLQQYGCENLTSDMTTSYYFTIFGDNIAIEIIIAHLFIFLFVCNVWL